MRLRTATCCETFLQILDMCLSNYQFIVYGDTEHLKVRSNWDDCVVAGELQLGIGFSYDNGLILRAVSFQAIFIVPFDNKN